MNTSKFEKITELTEKVKISEGNDVLLQQLQGAYHDALLLDLEKALDLRLEQELWNLGFKNYISDLKLKIQDKNNPQRNEAKTQLTAFIDTALGFYLGLLNELCVKFSLDLPFLRQTSTYGGAAARGCATKSRSVIYVCQYCLVHLGDLARYRGGQTLQAEQFYKHAIDLSPNSGHPYNQLALLSLNKGDELSTVFWYVRAISVPHPFPVAAANLEQTLQRHADVQLNWLTKVRLTSAQFVSVLLKYLGLCKRGDDVLDLASLMARSLSSLVATQEFSGWMLVQMLIVEIYMASVGTARQFQLMLDLIASSLCAYLLPVYTMKQDCLTSYCALPAIKITLQWILIRPELLKEQAFLERRQIWPGLCQLLNSLQFSVDFDADQYAKIPLPEDKDIQGFIHLDKYLSELRLKEMNECPDVPMLRCARIVNLGHQLASSGFMHVVDGKFAAVSNSQGVQETQQLMTDQLKATVEPSGWDAAVRQPKRQNVAMQAILRSKALNQEIVSPQYDCWNSPLMDLRDQASGPVPGKLQAESSLSTNKPTFQTDHDVFRAPMRSLQQQANIWTPQENWQTGLLFQSASPGSNLGGLWPTEFNSLFVHPQTPLERLLEQQKQHREGGT